MATFEMVDHITCTKVQQRTLIMNDLHSHKTHGKISSNEGTPKVGDM